MHLGCAACFSADDDGTPLLPFDPARAGCGATCGHAGWPGTRSGWSPRYADALRGLRAIWIDAGTRDEWYLDLGAEAFRDGSLAIGVARTIHFELFDATHCGIDYRYPLSLAWLAERLS